MVWPQLAAMAAMAALNKFTANKDQVKNIPTMTGQQRQMLSQILAGLGPQGAFGQGGMAGQQYLTGMLDPNSEVYKSMSEPYMQQFQQETVPMLAERFAGLGAMGGGLSSSGFGQALSSAGANLQSKLAAMRTAGQQGAAQNLMGNYQNMLGLGLGSRSFQPAYQQGDLGLFGPTLSSMGQGLGYQLGQGMKSGNLLDWLVNNLPGGV